MMHSHRRTKVVALAAVLVLAAAAPALAVPARGAAGGSGIGPQTDAGPALFGTVWHRLVDPLLALVGHPGAGAQAGDGPAALVERLGHGADPDGTPSTGSEGSGTTSEVSTPATDGPTD